MSSQPFKSGIMGNSGIEWVDAIYDWAVIALVNLAKFGEGVSPALDVGDAASNLVIVMRGGFGSCSFGNMNGSTYGSL